MVCIISCLKINIMKNLMYRDITGNLRDIRTNEIIIHIITFDWDFQPKYIHPKRDGTIEITGVPITIEQSECKRIYKRPILQIIRLLIYHIRPYIDHQKTMPN